MNSRASLVKLVPDLHLNQEFYYRSLATVQGKNANISKAVGIEVNILCKILSLSHLLIFQPSSIKETWKAATLKGITKGRKWTFDTSTDDTIVSCFLLSNDVVPFGTSILLLEGESVNLAQNRPTKDPIIDLNFNVNDFMKIGLKVDVLFHDTKSWFCGQVKKASNIQVTVDFVNNDPPIRLKPKSGEIRICAHNPQSPNPSKD